MSKLEFIQSDKMKNGLAALLLIILFLANGFTANSFADEVVANETVVFLDVQDMV